MTKDELLDLVNDITKESLALKDKYLSEKDFPIDYLTIFAHTDEELNKLTGVMDSLGDQVMDNNGPVYKLHDPISTPAGSLKVLRIRRPDINRPQKGCDDFAVDNYLEFKSRYLGKDSHFSLIERPDYEMIEIKDIDFDVLVYFPSITITKDLGIN